MDSADLGEDTHLKKISTISSAAKKQKLALKKPTGETKEVKLKTKKPAAKKPAAKKATKSQKKTEIHWKFFKKSLDCCCFTR